MKENEIHAEDISLAPPTDLFEEAKKIAETTANEDKFIFILQYDANRIDFLMSVLKAVGAEVILLNEEAYTLDAAMNMTQLAFVKPLDCIERVSTHEELKIAIPDEEIVTGTIAAEPLTTNTMLGRSAEVATASVGARSLGISCSTATNITMATAKEVSVESFTYGQFYYSTPELWYKFVVPKTKQYTICTTGTLDTVGELYDHCGNLITRVDDRPACGKLNFRILRTLQANQTYYVKVTEAKSKTGIFYLRVTEEILVDKIKFSPTSLCLTVGAEYELPVSPGTFLNIPGTTPLTALNVEIEPENATEKSLTWGVYDDDIINIKTVYKNGKSTQTIEVLKSGTARLSAFDKKTNGKSAECSVYAGGVPVTGISLNLTKKTMCVNDENYLSETILPWNALNRNVYWSSSDTSVAEINPAGRVKAKKIGTAVITAKTEDGGFTATCTISVVTGIVVEKHPDEEHSRIVFPNGKVWNCINFDIINNYVLDENDPESQRFYDNVYEGKTFDKDLGTIYNPPLKGYSNEELKIIYMIDSLGMAAYVREYAANLPDYSDNGQVRLSKIIGYKDQIFMMLFNRTPKHYRRDLLGNWYQTTDTSDWTDVVSESESLFGGHEIYDGKFWLEFGSLVLDLVSYAIGCPALKIPEKAIKALRKGIGYYSLLRSVSESVLNEDFNGFISAIINGSIDEDELDETINVNNTSFKSANYTLGWAFDLLSLSSDFGAFADMFRDGPHFYKEIFTCCANDTSYRVYLRTADDNMVAIDDIASVLD